MLKKVGAPCTRFVRIALSIGLTLPFIVAADKCPDGETVDVNAVVIAEFVKENAASIRISEALRVHRYTNELEQGDVVRPYSLLPTDISADERECQGEQGCLLFFVDSNHWAHFAHPTVIVLWDPGADRPNEKVKWVRGGWWPLVNEEPIFDTVRKREDWVDPADPDPMKTIIYPSDGGLFRSAPDQMDISIYPVRSSSLPSVGSPFFSSPTPCPVWAVLIAGYHDEGDTFNTDVSGMETVLRGHGIPLGHIFELMPNYDDSGPATFAGEINRLRATKANVEDVLTNRLKAKIETSAGGCGDFLLLFSSHGDRSGDDGSLRIEGGPISDVELGSWLAQVPCQRVTVVIEACHSGCFVDELAPIPTAPVTIAGGVQIQQEQRLLLTSTSINGQSQRDVDRLGGTTDMNPGDLGSETVWGYIEAFGTSMADSDADSAVSFSEAIGYGKSFDLTVIADGNLPQIRPAPAPNEIVHVCPVQPPLSALAVSLTQETPTRPADFGEVLRCRCNLFRAEISYPGGNPPPVATARFFWTDEPNPTWNATSQPHFKEIWDSTRLLPAQDVPHDFIVDWNVGSNIEEGDVITLLAIADSPRSGVPKGPMPLSELLLDNPQASALKLEAVDPSSCFLFPCGCRTLRCE